MARDLSASLTRLVKRGLLDANGNMEQLDPKEKVYFYQEDSRGLVDKADPDLHEYGCDPVPWRSVYGFAQNSQILDRAFRYTSIVIILVWNFAPSNSSHLLSWSAITTKNYVMILVAYASVATMFLAGELDRLKYGKKAIPLIQQLRNIETNEEVKNYMFDTITQIEKVDILKEHLK